MILEQQLEYLCMYVCICGRTDLRSNAQERTHRETSPLLVLLLLLLLGSLSDTASLSLSVLFQPIVTPVCACMYYVNMMYVCMYVCISVFVCMYVNMCVCACMYVICILE